MWADSDSKSRETHNAATSDTRPWRQSRLSHSESPFQFQESWYIWYLIVSDFVQILWIEPILLPHFAAMGQDGNSILWECDRLNQDLMYHDIDCCEALLWLGKHVPRHHYHQWICRMCWEDPGHRQELFDGLERWSWSRSVYFGAESCQQTVWGHSYLVWDDWHRSPESSLMLMLGFR